MKKYLPFAIIILTAGIFIYFGFFKKGEAMPLISDLQKTQLTDTAGWETKTDDQAGVTVVVTPLELREGSQEWRFEITMSTHSVELDQDLIEASLLVDEGGNEFKPIRWDGPVGGHHREGVLVFNPISPLPQLLELKITGISDTVRSFAWQLK